MSVLRLVCTIWILVLCACTNEQYRGLQELLNPVAWQYPDLDSTAWEIIVEDETLGGTINTSGVFAGGIRTLVFSRTVDGSRTVEVDEAGAISLIDRATAEIHDTRELGAVAVAWSNSGRRLAVVTREASLPATEAHALLILDESLDEQMRFELDLPLPDMLSSYRTFVVSWKADDSQIAVSVDAVPPRCIPSVLNSSVLARCLVVTLGDGAQSTYELTNVYFLDDDWVVGSAPDGLRVDTSSANQRVYAMRLDNGDIIERVFMQGSEFAVASYAPEGLFASAEEVAGFSPCQRNLHLRSRFGRSRATIGNTWFYTMPASLFPSAR